MINNYILKAYVGEEFKGQGFTELEYQPWEKALIFRTTSKGDGEETEIWLEPDCLDAMIKELNEFSKKLKLIIEEK